jgi:outer membrane protein assembly factor BamE (lipoprotein component of BamABCDE complex)
MCSRFLRLPLLLVCLALLGACQPGKRLTKANVDQVTDGMAKKQVESILGLPTTVETKDSAALKKTTYLYTQANGTVTISFKDDKVESKESTLSE